MAERFVEVVVRGPRGWDIGFLRGFLRGRGLGGLLLDGEEEGMDCEPLREKLAELFDPSADTLHLLCPETILPAVREALESAAQAGKPLTLLHVEPVRGLAFHFAFRVFSRDLGERVRGLFADLPEGAVLGADTRLEEHVDPEAKGVELYAPAHDYELEGRGSVEGDLLPVLEVFRACKAFTQVHADKAKILRP